MFKDLNLAVCAPKELVKRTASGLKPTRIDSDQQGRRIPHNVSTVVQTRKRVHREDKSVDLIQDSVRLVDPLSCIPSSLSQRSRSRR